MNNEELKLQSIEKISNAIKILSDNNEKTTNKRISEVSGLSEITVKRYKKEIVLLITENVSSTIKVLQENMKSVSPKFINRVETVSPTSFKPLKPSLEYSDNYNRFLIRCIKDPNIPSAYMTKDELKQWENLS